jgi:hypothetical protein
MQRVAAGVAVGMLVRGESRCARSDTLKNPNSSSATLNADVVEDPLEWHPRLAGSPAVPQPVGLLELAFALPSRSLRYRRAHTEFPDEGSSRISCSGWGSKTAQRG